MRRRLLGGLALLGILIPATVATADAHPARAHAASAQQCAEPFPAQRDPSNPLDLPSAPGADPLSGANFFVDGPAHGSAASTIASLVGLDPKRLANSESWATFERQLTSGGLSHRLSGDPALAYKVHELEKIASQPEAQRFSMYSGGGGPGAIFKQVQKILCANMTADPGTIPIINTYFLHPALGGCPTAAQVQGAGPVFRRRVDELAEGIGRRPAVMLLELDAIGSSSCIAHDGAMADWEAALRYEINAVRALPHTVVYVEAGYSDGNSPSYTARILNAIGVNQIRGFFTNDTHQNWTSAEVHWAQQISKLTHGAHFIVNTSDNGRGPKLNPHPVTQGTEALCNPPDRGIGPMDTTVTTSSQADAFLWTHPPGNSSGSCGGGTPSGTFWAAKAISMAAFANSQLGPGYPSRPY